MSADSTSSADSRVVDEFLNTAASRPSSLVIEGEPGIGKTTLWTTVTDRARDVGFRVLSAWPAETESVLAYASLADLLTGTDDRWAELPRPQRHALEHVLARAGPESSVTVQHAVAAAFLSVVHRLADRTPVLIAIDDLQWLDPSTTRVFAFAVRRLSARVGVVATARTDSRTANGASWLQLPRPRDMHRVEVKPLSLGRLHTMLTERLGRALPRPTLVRIDDMSGGNPLFALELARALNYTAPGKPMVLPGTLIELVRTRVGVLDDESQHTLLAAACAAAPTVELVAAAAGTDVEHVERLLEAAEDKGIIGIDGNKLRFAHPLLARGVYDAATPATRRRMHRRLAEIVDQPELQARHLALAAMRGDPETLDALDVAAEMARVRGAPAAAAELIDLAIGLGGDTPERRIRAAYHHFNAGDLARAQAVLEDAIANLPAGRLRAGALYQLAAVRLFGDGGYPEALEVLQQALGEAGGDHSLRVQILVTLSSNLLNAGDLVAAARNIEDAVADATQHGLTQSLSQALGVWTLVRYTRGEGLDKVSMQRAMALEDKATAMLVAFRPTMQNALLLGSIGELEQARKEMASIRRDCVERGDESEQMFAVFYGLLIETWCGNFAEADLEAEEAVDRATQLGAGVSVFLGLTIRANLAAHLGRVDEARRDAGAALTAGQNSGNTALVGLPIACLGFVEISLGNYRAAVAIFEPLLPAIAAVPDSSELLLMPFLPDAIEALIHMGRLEEAEVLITNVERNGRRLDRAWMLAIGARCRSTLLAARGDLDAATRAAHEALVEHERLPMPFERARTQVMLGQLQRRQLQKEKAAATLNDALNAFEAMGTPLWAARARAELARTNVAPTRTGDLTPSEQRVAELAATGMTNRDVAAALFISPKTVEANLSRIYRKLNIRSRAELGRWMTQTAG
jgi:DNA-binding CsgD family transcriptional regulator